MRSLAGCCGLTIVVLLTGAPTAAHADWCAVYLTGGTNCGFRTFNQCMAAVSGVGGSCNQSASSEAAPPPERRRPRAKAPAPKRKAVVRQPQQPASAPNPQPPASAAKAHPPAANAVAQPPAATAPTAAPPGVGKFAAARQLILDGHYEDGLKAMRELGPENHADAASYVGLALSKLGRTEEASVWFEKALKVEPMHLKTLEFYGELRAQRGDLGGARLALAKIKLICGNANCTEYLKLAGVIAAKSR